MALVRNPPFNDDTLGPLGRFTQTWQAWFTALQTIINSVRNSNGGILLTSMSDASAAVNTLYYSTDISKAAYKDPAGVVHALY